MSSTVEDWLRSLGLIQYTQAFLDNGYDELDICKEIGEEDLDAIGVKNMKDRVDILSAVNRLKQSGTAVYFVLEEGTQPTPSTQAREKIIPLKLKMLIRDTLEEDNIKLSEYPYTLSNGLRGNLENLVTLYADKFYTYEEDVFDALESIRVRQVGEMQAELINNHKGNENLSSTNENTSTSKHQHKRSHTTPLPSTSETTGWHTAPSSLTTKNVDPADYLDVDTQSSPHKKHKRRRPVERNSKLSRSLDSLKELHVNTDLKTKADKDTSTSKPVKQSSIFGIFRSSKRRNASNEDKSHETKSVSNNIGKPVAGAEFPASNITMGEEDRVALMLMVKNGELTVEEAVQQMESYEKEHKKVPNDSTRTSSSCSEEESPKSQHKIKRGLFGRSTKKKSISRPGSEIAACDMTMSEEDRINLMKNVRDHQITVEDALQKLLSFEEDSHSPKPRPIKPKFSPKSPHSSFSRLSIKRVSGAFSSVGKGGPPKDVPTAVFYAPQEGSHNTSSEEESAHLPSDSSPDPSPAGHRKTGHELLKNAKHNQIRSTSSLHSSSSSSDAVDRLGTIDDTDTQGHQGKKGVAPPENQILNEMKNVFAKRVTPNHEEANPPPAQTSTLPRNGRPKPPSLSRKSSLPLTPTHKPPLPTPTHPIRKAPPPPPRQIPKQATVPAVETPGIEKGPPPIPARNDVEDKLPLPPANLQAQRQLNVEKPEQLKGSPSQTVNNSANSNRYSLDDDVFPPPPPEALLIGEPEVPHKQIIIKPPRPSIKKPERITPKDVDEKSNTVASAQEQRCTSGVPPVTKPKPVVKKKPKLPPKPPAKPGTNLKEDPDEKCAEVARDESSSLSVPDLPVPKKRPSHSLSDLIERRLRIEQIDLTDLPYSKQDGSWDIPINLVDRYTEEMRRSQKEVVDIMDRIRCSKLKEKGRSSIPCDLSLYPQEPDHLGVVDSLEDWLVSLGLPMYIDNLKEVEYDDMSIMPHLKQKHFEYAGVVDLRHMRRLLASVERMSR